MSLHFTFRNIDTSDAVKEHIEKKVAKFKKFVTYPMEINVILELEKAFYTAELSCHAEHKDLFALAKTKDLYEAIDMVTHKIETQLKKERERKKGHTAAHTVARPKALKLASDLDASIPHKDKKRSAG